MKKKGIVFSLIVAVFSSTQLIAAGNAPIQRIDVTNQLSNGSTGPTLTPVLLSFDNDNSVPCFTTTLAYNAQTTIYAGKDQACVKAITSVTFTPLAGTSAYSTYDAPTDPIYIASGFYLAQMTISQNTVPLFDPLNGVLISTGTMKVTTLNYLK